MSIQADQNEFNQERHILHVFDEELHNLHALLMGMANLVLFQLEQAMQALDEGDMDIAGKVVVRDNEVDEYEIKIDAEVLVLLVKLCPVAKDLRTIIFNSKIAVELEKIGDEIAVFAKLVMVLFDPKSSDPNPSLLTDVVKIGNLVKLMLEKLVALLESNESKVAYGLLENDLDCENELKEGIKHQLMLAVQDARMIRRALDLMQIMKSLERCGEYCKNIAEHIIFMVEGVDVRHCSTRIAP